ncbi:response regulator [Rhodospirillum rubrum]|uniref:Response regulator receiver domain protein (CheY) n=1 Tax=Rhodospirillum rubrum (strain ATCC 11170 / ATH 1.1.1 / DSM 467 / LMG 4362 / NCIMB 8255 / S1) TaxID=269796 RepID=Q2RRW3_RHORT|nr:response regulator [Rhodospirillum rubrum]ABC23132.1 Response regulator receiver domain protein (CheY) [Rhodospirillum rubrum ATCC 11170]AEO48862.1 response regulator receiver domain-containing protein [Rhodospirillum rubrum F11]MBK5954746.1 response regulator [Rhodospirillum rubrum]QXG79116.1 response regulator [Rhodospirillum rubrum]HAQ01022.1 response regulator [Rhodospirillum rubrum]
MSAILIVDDVPVVRLVLARILKKAGHSVYEAGSGVEALDIVAHRPIEVLLTDLWMPEGDGIALLGRIKSGHPRIARIAMSGGTPHTSLGASLAAAGAVEGVIVLTKPIEKADLLDAIERSLAEAGR